MAKRFCIVSGFIIFAACSKAPDMQKRSFKPDPIREPPAYELLTFEDSRSFVQLPMNGNVRDQKRFWSGDYWPLKKGNINRRWNAPIRIGFNHRSPTLDELRLLTEEKISHLAPSEKFDLLMGAYDYPLKKEVAKFAANEEAEIWEGMSNGWAVSSVRHFEPQPKVLVNPDGVTIPFGSEDIKGLLAYYYTFHHPPKLETIVGQPCLKINCDEDITAATFHLALLNSIGVRKQGLLMDLDRTRDVWNHPVVAYESEYRGNAELHEKVTFGTHSVIRIKTTVTYIDEVLSMTWAPALGSPNQLETKQVYQYWLHLDRDGVIIGGEWKSNERPDFIWTVKEAGEFEGKLAGLKNLLDDPLPVGPEVVVTEETLPEEETIESVEIE